MINNVVILSLDKRKDLWLDLKVDCESRGWNARNFIVGDGLDSTLSYDRIDRENLPDEWIWRGTGSPQKAYWAFLSHQEIIKIAMQNNWENLLMLEDDAYITKRFGKIWARIEKSIQNLKWDILYLGWHAFEYKNHLFDGRNLDIENKYKENEDISLMHIQQCGGLFGSLINKSLYKTILDMKPIKPVDSQLNDIRYKIHSYNVCPIIVWIKSCFSECEQTIIKRDYL